MTRAFFIFVYAGILVLAPLSFSRADFLSQIIKNQQNISIDISSLVSFLDTLPPDEKEEQTRDWALLGLLSKLGISQVKISEILQGAVPMRYPFLKGLAKSEISQGRIKYVSDKDAVILVPEDKLEDKSLIGSILDRKYCQENYCPELIHIFGYKAVTANGTILVSYNKTVPAKIIFSQQYNYLEKEIRNLDDFNLLVNSIDDITCIKWKERGVTLGGRKYPSSAQRSLSPEDIATLYQAYNVRTSPEKEEQNKHDYNMFINRQYEDVLKRNAGLKKALLSGKIKRSQILAEIRRQIPYTRMDERDTNAGFSLDTDFNYHSISDYMVRISTKDPSLVMPQNTELTSYIDANNSSILSAAEQIKKTNGLEPLLVLLRKYDSSSNNAEKYLADVLKHIEAENSYQVARYDGPLQGTSPGMILFYTDLTAKLWALDYNGIAPKNNITGFKTMPGIKVPKLYWDDFVKLSKTRLWFGVRQESFNVYSKKLLFEPIATRVYAASSNPLFPGKESMPNFQSAEFLGWWDSHYQAVADFEPQYHKLNQIQKWSCILVILKEEKNRTLDFLFDVPVQRGNNFEEWYVNTGYLKSKAQISFLDRKKNNKSTECLPLYYSQDYPLMGQKFYLYGGVSLASKKDIMQKLHKTQPAASKASGTAVPSKYKGPAGAKNLQPAAKGPEETKPKPKQTINITEDKNKLILNCRINNIDYGNLAINKKENSVKLDWDKNSGILLNDLINKLVEIQQSRQPGYKDEALFRLVPAIESIVRVESWKAYLVKSSSIKSKWIYLSVNDNAKSSGYIAQNAGTEPDSDIFQAKFINDTQYNKIVKEKQTIKIY